MIRFTHYHGHEVWVMPERVLCVVDEGCGSRGVSAGIRLDNGQTISVSGRAEDVAEKIRKAKP